MGPKYGPDFQNRMAATQWWVRQDNGDWKKDITNGVCRPGIEIMRKVGDPHSAEVAICVDITGEAGLKGLTFTHGSNKRDANGYQIGGWKNELFGDGHVEARRIGDMQPRWGGQGTNRDNAAGGAIFW